jgi:hypothetical protein
MALKPGNIKIRIHCNPELSGIKPEVRQDQSETVAPGARRLCMPLAANRLCIRFRLSLEIRFFWNYKDLEARIISPLRGETSRLL